MKKHIHLSIILVIVLSTITVSSSPKTFNLEKTKYQNENDISYNEPFIEFLKTGLEHIVENNEYDRQNIIKRTYMVEMRDGTHLATDVYLPLLLFKSHGTILLRTPYGKDDLEVLGLLLAVIGWPTVIQDMRGTHDSKGIYQGFRKCHTDGPDTLKWINTRDWSNGKIATIGPSAFGITQYYTAGANPPELACQGIMVATPNLHKHAVYQGGELRKQLVEKWLESVGASYLLEEIFNYENYSLDYWTNVSLEDNWQDVNVPAIHLGGWYDCFLGGIIDGYLGYQNLGGPGAAGKSKLIIGPWTHDGYIEYKQGQLTYPENSMEIVKLILMYLDMIEKYTMGKNNNYDDYSTVQYYVMGDVDVIDAPGNEWRYADDWPIQADYESWYFHENGILSRNNQGNYDPMNYIYDPTRPVPTIGGQNLEMPPGPYDQTSIENRDDVLLFTSDILTEPYEATGPIKARLYVSSDCPDTDFTVKLTDVYPDGRSMLISDGILRMRNRNGTDHWEFMEPSEIYEIEVDLWATSYIWNTGHKIRVAVSSSNYPRFLTNPNTKDSIYKNDSYNIANNSLYIDSDHPSCIILPEIDQGAASNPPEKPSKPSGRQRIKFDKYYLYESTTNDPDGDKIYLLFDWDDNTSSGWLGPYKSGETVHAFHKWNENGPFNIRVKAKDINGTHSQWSDPLLIQIPKNKSTTYPMILRLIEYFPAIKAIFNNYFKYLLNINSC
jgi:predicted acyl esterase